MLFRSPVFNNGSGISAPTTTSFQLTAGRVYQIMYILSATVTIAGYIGVTPRINGTAQTALATTSSSTLSSLTPGVSASFIINATAAVTLDFLFNASLTASSPQGTVSIVRLS